MSLPCVILAGGLGTRMKPYTESMPKALIPVRGKPFLEHQIRWLEGQGVRDILLCIAHQGEQIRDFIRSRGPWKAQIRFSDEGPTLLGTAGALRAALDQGLLPREFFLQYGDSYLPIEYAPVETAYRESGLPALMTVQRNEGRWDRSNARYANGRVILYDKTYATAPESTFDFIDYGLSILRSAVLTEHAPSGQKVDLAAVFHSLSTGGQLAGYEIMTRFYEVGTPQGLKDLENYLITNPT